MENYIVGIGEILWDMLPAGKQLGGAPANFAYHVEQLGLSAKVVSAVGNDTLGTEILNTLKKKYIPSQIVTLDYPTGTVEVSLDEAGIPSYDIKRQVAWDNLPITEELVNLAKQTKVACFGSLAQRSSRSRDTICQFLDSMSEKGVLKVFDINLRQQFYNYEILHQSLIRCNVLKINNEELEIVSKLFCIDSEIVEEKCRFLLRKYELEMVILTCGEEGSYVITNQETSFLPTPEVEVVDTVGAGDAFTAAFIAGLLKGNSVVESHKLAVQVAAFVCTKSGAMPEYGSVLSTF